METVQCRTTTTFKNPEEPAEEPQGIQAFDDAQHAYYHGLFTEDPDTFADAATVPKNPDRWSMGPVNASRTWSRAAPRLARDRVGGGRTNLVPSSPAKKLTFSARTSRGRHVAPVPSRG